MKTQLVAEAERFIRERRPPAPSWRLRLNVRLRTRALDSRLAEGANPLTDPQLALRARQLADPETRGRFATTLERIVGCSDTTAPASRASPALSIATAVSANRTHLLRLAGRLRDERTVCERGVAMISLLLADGSSPLYDDHANLPLDYCARMALLCLDP